jgi:signal transduction histidine kinase
LQTGAKQKFTVTVGKRKITIVGNLSRIHLLETPYLLAIFSDVSEKLETERALLVAREVSVENLKRALLAEKKNAGIGEETRRQIGQELHDDLGQHLTGLAFMVENLAHDLQLKQLPESLEASRIKVLINEAIQKTRLLASQLYPLLSAKENLETRLTMLLQHIEATFGIACHLDCPSGLINDPEVAANLYRIAQESVHNAVKHSGCNKVSLRLYAKPNAILMEVADNGQGMDEKRLSSAYNGLGIQIMHNRAALLGATLTFHALPGGGVKLLVTLPTHDRGV